MPGPLEEYHIFRSVACGRVRADAASANFAQQFRQLCNIRRNPPRLIAREQLGR
jgi:hypothetical protein